MKETGAINGRKEENRKQEAGFSRDKVTSAWVSPPGSLPEKGKLEGLDDPPIAYRHRSMKCCMLLQAALVDIGTTLR